ncbi:flagellar assembly protein FliW [Desulfonatronovibrio hydrogenovorans]|uniref:flagellar assembly protein FliW n=1 Tax=Desulfonatronovibrio hydrogenovorans TaxID=53245 RepID=UPI0005538275|nr:flagellar assembly protein FliW [Desulfonatronovibrio hydrogenovorans]
MDKKEQRKINSRLGQILVDEQKSIHFPRGLIGMERAKDFVLLQIKPDSPFYLLQNLENSRLGLLVADPFAFISDYQVHLGRTEERILQNPKASDLAIMVTMTIPQGCPEKATLNMTGPIVINISRRMGMQIAQSDPEMKTKIVLSELHQINGGIGKKS